MIGKELLSQRDISLGAVKKILAKRKKKSELSYEQNTALEYSAAFAPCTEKKAEELIEELQKVGKIDREAAVMIANIAPKDEDDLRVILEKKLKRLEPKEIKKVLDLVAKHTA